MYVLPIRKPKGTVNKVLQTFPNSLIKLLYLSTIHMGQPSSMLLADVLEENPASVCRFLLKWEDTFGLIHLVRSIQFEYLPNTQLE